MFDRCTVNRTKNSDYKIAASTDSFLFTFNNLVQQFQHRVKEIELSSDCMMRTKWTKIMDQRRSSKSTYTTLLVKQFRISHIFEKFWCIRVFSTAAIVAFKISFISSMFVCMMIFDNGHRNRCRQRRDSNNGIENRFKEVGVEKVDVNETEAEARVAVHLLRGHLRFPWLPVQSSEETCTRSAWRSSSSTFQQ